MLKIASGMSADADVFRAQRYLLAKSLLPPDVLRLLQSYSALLFATGRFTRDSGFARSLCLYGDAGFDAVLEWLAPELGTRLGLELCPTYSYARMYGQGDALHRHVDRPACEVSVTLALKVPGGGESVIGLKPPGGPEVSVQLDEGDGCVYAGTEVEHWRDAVPRGGVVQLFLHYIDKAGPHYPAHRFDRRAQLGTPLIPER